MTGGSTELFEPKALLLGPRRAGARSRVDGLEPPILGGFRLREGTRTPKKTPTWIPEVYQTMAFWAGF